MENSFAVYVPSAKRHLRFREITSHDCWILSKSTESNVDFCWISNQLLREKLITEYDGSFTILDKFVILLVLRIHCVGDTIQLKTTSESATTVISLSDWMYKLNDVLVNPPTNQRIGCNRFNIDVGIPTIEYEHQSWEAALIESADIEVYYNKSQMLWISAFDNTPTHEFGFADVVHITSKIPADLIKRSKYVIDDLLNKHEYILNEKTDNMPGIKFSFPDIQNLLILLFSENSNNYLIEKINLESNHIQNHGGFTRLEIEHMLKHLEGEQKNDGPELEIGVRPDN